MDAGMVRGLGTLVLFVSFIALVIWAWLPRQREHFDEAARLPFRDDEAEADSVEAGRGQR